MYKIILIDQHKATNLKSEALICCCVVRQVTIGSNGIAHESPLLTDPFVRACMMVLGSQKITF